MEVHSNSHSKILGETNRFLDPQEMNRRRVRDFHLLFEYKSLKSYGPLGVYVLPQTDSMHTWHGVIFLRQGDYKNAVFKFRIEIPEEYPNARPKVIFESYVYHPLVDMESGVLNLNPQFQEWRPRKDFIFVLLAYIKKIFYNREYYSMSAHISNPVAFRTFLEDEDGFLHKVRQCVDKSDTTVLENYPNTSVNFCPFQESNHEELMNRITETESSISEAEQAEAYISWFRQKYSYAVPTQ